MAKMLEVWRDVVYVGTLSMVLILSLGFPRLSLSCPHPCACYFSTEVHCTFRSLTAVPTRFPKQVERINLGFNNIHSVSKVSFGGLRKLELLMLHGNDIQRIPDEAFKDLQSLQVLKMSYNKVSAITGQTFQGLVNLLRLHIDHNKIEFIQPGAFYGLTSLKLVQLEGNLLQQIHPNTFVTFSLLRHFKISSIKHLYLADNSIRTLPREMLHSMSQLESIYLHGNPWSCDCRLKWLLDWEKEAGGVVKCKKDRTYPGGRLCSVCSEPRQFAKRELFKLGSNDLACTRPKIESPLKMSNSTEWEDDEGEDLAQRHHQKPFGSMALNLTDEQGNNNNLLCQVHRLKGDTSIQWQRLNPREIGVNLTLSVNLICNMDQENMERLWKLIAYYSETPAKLQRDLMLSKEPTLSYRYRQATDNEAYYYTGVRANIMAGPSWLMQQFVTIQLDRRHTTASHVVLLFSMYLSQHFPLSDAARDTSNWVLIRDNEGAERGQVAVAGTMLQLNCRVTASGSPSLEWLLPDGTQLKAPYSSADNRISVSDTGKLVVKAVDLGDSGLYQCTGAIEDETDTMTSRVAVRPARVHASRVESGITVLSGDAISLPCTAISVPDARLNWVLPNNNVLGAPSNTTDGFVTENGTLVIATSHISDSGHYRCIAINKYGSDSLTVKVAVIKKLHGRPVKKGKAVRVPPPKVFIRPEDPEVEEQGSGLETPHESQKQVTYNKYTGGIPAGGRELHADATQGHSKVKAIKLRKGSQRGRVKTTAEGRRRWDSRRRVNVSNKQIDPQRWADILAKVRGKTVPKVTIPTSIQVYESTTASPATRADQVHAPAPKQSNRPDPEESSVEESSAIGELNFSEDELIHVSTPRDAMVKVYNVPETTTLEGPLNLKLQGKSLQQTPRGDINSANNQSSGTPHTADPVLQSTTESSRAAKLFATPSYETDICEFPTASASTLEQAHSEPTREIIKMEPTQEPGDYDASGTLGKTNAPTAKAHKEMAEPWTTEAVAQIARKLPGKGSIIDGADVNSDSDKDSPHSRGSPTTTSGTVTTSTTTEATRATISAPASTTNATSTTTLTATTTAKATSLTAVVPNTTTKPAIVTTAAAARPSMAARATASKAIVPRILAKAGTDTTANARAGQSRTTAIIASRKYSRKRLHGRRRYRPNRYRQRQHLHPKFRAKEEKPTRVNMVATTQPTMKAVPTEKTHFANEQIIVKTTVERVSAASVSSRADSLQLTTEGPKLKSADVLAIIKSPHIPRSPGKAVTQGPHRPEPLTSTTQTALETTKAAFSNRPEVEPTNPDTLTHQTKALFIQVDLQLHNSTKLAATTVSPLIAKTFAKPPDPAIDSDSLESDSTPVSTTTTMTLVVPVGSGKTKGLQDSRQTLGVTLNSPVLMALLPITTAVTSTSEHVMKTFSTTTASNRPRSRETPKSKMVPKIPTTTVLATETEPPVIHPSTFQQHRSDVTPKAPSSPDTTRAPSLFPGQNVPPQGQATEHVVSGSSWLGTQPTTAAFGHAPLWPSQATLAVDKGVLPPAIQTGSVISPQGALPTQKTAGVGVRKQDRGETSESNNEPDRVLSRLHTATTPGRQQVKEPYMGRSSNLTWISRRTWKADANLSTMSILSQGSGPKAPKYIPVGATQKPPTPATRVWSHYFTAGAPSTVTDRPGLGAFAPRTVQNASKSDEPFIKRPAATSAPLFRTSPVIFNKLADRKDAGLSGNSKTPKTNYRPPFGHSVAPIPNTHQWHQHVRVPFPFIKVKSSAAAPLAVPASAPTSAPTKAATAQSFRSTLLNNRLYYTPIRPPLGGSSSNTAQLSPNLTATEGKPEIVTRSPLTVSVKAEMDAYLPCDTTGEPKPFVSWTKVSTGAVMTTRSKTQRFEVFGNGTFGIRNAQVQDRGQYMCVAWNPLGTDKMVVTLVVLAQQPRIVGARYKDATVYLGEPFAAECRAEGTPAPHVSWLLPGRKLLRTPGSGGGASSLSLSPNGTLAIDQTAFSDRGVYKCIASNAVGADTVTVRLHVAALPPMIQQERTENISVVPGQGARVHCTAKAAPPANIRWVLFDGTQIRPSQFINGNLFVFPNGTLYIRKLSDRDVGNYECVATNVVGIARRTVSINIQKHSATAKITVSSPQKVDISYGRALHLDCVAAGDPGPRILWRLPSKLLVDSRYSYSKRIKVYNNGTLVVHSVTDRDAGDYLCVARNKMGDDFMVLKVNVMMKPAKIEYKQEANHKVMYGKDLKVDCIASGLPDPEISWGLPDGTMVNSVMQSDDSGTRMRRYVVFDNGTLYFNEVGLKDEGDYTCYAVNQIGKDEMKVNVKVVAEPPTFKGGALSRVTVAYGETCTIQCAAKGEPTPWITWYSPTNRFIPPSSKHQVTTDGALLIQKVQRSDSGNYTCIARNMVGESKRVVTVEVDIEPPSINGQKSTNTVIKEMATRDSRKQIDCKAEGIPAPRVMWVLPENVIVTAPYYGNRIQVHRNGTLDIRSLKKSDAVHLVCIAHNEGGEARLTVQLEVLDRLEKPSFTNPLSAGVSIVIGNSVNLNCSSRGSPAPETTWILPDGKRLASGQQLPKVYHGSDGTLHINSPSATEAGAYRCIARNTVGSIERLVTLEIGHKPEIRNRYTSLVRILPGESMRLDCTVGGNPVPQLSWVLPNGVMLNRPQNGGRFSLLQNGSLIVHEASVYDRGTYSCRAVSELGVTFMSVAVIVIAYPPRITNGPTPVTYARHGSKVQLNCMAMGIPKAEVSWELPDKTRLTVTSQARLVGNKYLHPQGSLILQNPSNRDTGFYKCTAKNLLGSDSKITYVHVF